jgi:hypothetical protein
LRKLRDPNRASGVPFTESCSETSAFEQQPLRIVPLPFCGVNKKQDSPGNFGPSNRRFAKIAKKYGKYGVFCKKLVDSPKKPG